MLEITDEIVGPAGFESTVSNGGKLRPYASNGKLLLIVDDEPPLLRLLEFLFSRQGYQVRTAANGLEALEILQRERPSLIVLDVMMPRMDGYQVATAVRSNPELADIPIVMLTAKAQEEDQERGMAVGVDTYVTKPFEPERLTEIVAEYLTRTPVKNHA
jgi:CheY-like chemotaxis protein